MLSSVEQAFVGRDEKRAPLKTLAQEAKGFFEKLYSFTSGKIGVGVLTNPFVYIRDTCVTYRTYLVNAQLQCRFLGMVNRPFPSSTNSHFKKGAKCETLAVQMGFICVRIKSRFHINGFSLNLALKQIKGLGPVQNGLLQVFEERKSAEELQSTIFIMDTVGTLGQRPHQWESVIGGVTSVKCLSFIFSQDSAPVLIIGMSVIAVAGVRKTRVDCTCYIDCSKISQLQVRIAFAY